MIGTAMGSVMMSVRDKAHLLSTAIILPEKVGTIANDQLAAYLLTRLCQPGKTFLDVGAHIGSVTAEVMRNDPTVKIVAIEAMPDKAEALRKKFPTVDVISSAVGFSKGEVPFYVNVKRSGYSSLGRPVDSSDIKEIRVPLDKLDNLLADYDNIDVMKIDVEGAELGVIMGGGKIIRDNCPVIMFESALSDASSSTEKMEVYNHLSDLGYAIYLPNRVAHEGFSLTRSGFLESHTYPRRTTNYFAIPAERRIEVMGRARKILGIG
jgi:FkbM family methyltransferase